MIRNLIVIAFLAAAAAEVTIYGYPNQGDSQGDYNPPESSNPPKSYHPKQSYNPPKSSTPPQSYLPPSSTPKKCYPKTIVKTEVKTEIRKVSHGLKYEQISALF